jgi:DNA repair protein RadC
MRNESHFESFQNLQYSIAGFSFYKGATMTKIREQLQMYGANTLSTTELLAYILGNRTDHQEAASKLLEMYSLSQLQSADWADMTSAGLSKAQAQRLNAVCELARRLAQVDPGKPIQIKSPFDAISLLKPMMMHLDHEEFRVLGLDLHLRVVSNTLLYRGTVGGCEVRAAEVFKVAIARKCPFLIVAHNHPAGSAEASEDDIETTKRLVAAGNILDVGLLDHVIIGNPRYTSLKELLKW